MKEKMKMEKAHDSNRCYRNMKQPQRCDTKQRTRREIERKKVATHAE